MITTTELARRVKILRDAQRLYFRTRFMEHLEHARQVEKQIDTLIKEILDEAQRGPGLFKEIIEEDHREQSQ